MKTKCITFDKQAQDALPEEIKAKMKADKEKARRDIQLKKMEKLSKQDIGRVILHRGKKEVSKEWVYGFLTVKPSYGNTQAYYIECVEELYKDGKFNGLKHHSYPVMPETVGQFTGLKTGKYKMNLDPDIYEGDLFRGLDADDNDIFYVVMWIDQRGAFYMVPIDHYTVIRDNDASREKEFDWLFQDALLYDFSIDVGLMKVGTIYDNPEMIEL